MVKYTHRQITEFVKNGVAVNITCAGFDTYDRLNRREGCLTKMAYSEGPKGRNGLLLKGNRTETYYAICHPTPALHIFGQEGIDGTHQD